MTIGLPGFDIKKWRGYADWKLLAFLLLFLNVKLAVKIPAVVIIYALQFNFKFGFKLKNSRLPLFYLLAIALPVLSMVVNKSYQNPNYLLVLSTGIGFWALCIMAIHQVKLSVDGHNPEVIHRTILLFFIINIAFSALNMLSIIWETGTINPYLYQGDYQKYFIGTGDYIRGLTFDTSTTNAVLNAMGVLYFLVRKNYVMLLVCMATLLLTGSNFVNIVLLLILAGLFIFKSTRDQKSMIAACFMFLVVFMAKVSPQNNKYLDQTVKNVFVKPPVVTYHPPAKVLPIEYRPDSTLSAEDKKLKQATIHLDSISLMAYRAQQKQNPQPDNKTIVKTPDGRIIIPQANIDSEPYQSLKTPLSAEEPLIRFINLHKQWLPISANTIQIPSLPGKAIGMIQTAKFFAQHPGKILLGDGMGNFSSKLAFRATGLGMAGGYPQKRVYINHDFMQNHLDLYLNFFSKVSGYHSLTNSPFSVYDQLLTEYGLIGLLAFVIFYLGFFARHYRTLTYGLPILILIMAVFFIDYWFEQLSVIVFFELLLLLNIKETSNTTLGGPANA